jgi:hypothetical protein
MGYLIICSIILALIVTTFILLIFMPNSKCYFDFDDIGNDLAKFSYKDHFDNLLNEQQDITYDDNGIHMLYQNNELHPNMDKHPKLYELLKTVPNVERVFIKHIKKKTETKKQKGSANTSNNTLRCILPIKIPAAKKSGMWLDGQPYLFMDMNWVIYDDSRESTVYNQHKRNDLHLLVIDVTRPKKVPIGIAIDSHSQIF